MQRHVFIWSIYLYCVCTYAYIYIYVHGTGTHNANQNSIQYIHICTYYINIRIYTYIVCDYTTILHQWLHKHHGSFKQHDHGPETATGSGAPTSTSSKEDTAVQRPCCKMLTWGWWQPEFPVNSPIEVGSWNPIIYKVLHIYTSKRWLGMGFLNHQQYCNQQN